jgi:hypothetical protein
MKIKLEIKLPKGWMRLTPGRMICRADRIPHTESMTWKQVPTVYFARHAGSDYVQPNEFVIRKKNR